MERNVKVKIDHVEKIYDGRQGKMVALNGVDLDIYENEFICVVGPSGCGKSTLLNIIAGLLEPTSGAVYVDGKKVEGTGMERGRHGARCRVPAVCFVPLADRQEKCYVWPETEGPARR